MDVCHAPPGLELEAALEDPVAVGGQVFFQLQAGPPAKMPEIKVGNGLNEII